MGLAYLPTFTIFITLKTTIHIGKYTMGYVPEKLTIAPATLV